MHTFDPSTQEAETGESLKVQGQPTLQSELQDIQDYTEKPCFEKIKKKKKKGFIFVCVCSPAGATSLLVVQFPGQSTLHGERVLAACQLPWQIKLQTDGKQCSLQESTQV